MNGQQVPAEGQRPGYRTLDPVAILSVEDTNGKILDEFRGPQQSQVLSPQVTFMMNSILTDNNARLPLFAPNGPLKLSRPAGAKTGTTDNNRDLWTMGYTPDLVTGVWVGNSDNQEIGQVLGSMAAGPIWHDFMEEVLAGTPATDWDTPGGLERVEVSAVSGLRAGKYCPDKVTEWFARGTAPTKECDIHRQVVIDKTTGEPATPETKPEDREEKVIEVYPEAWAAWAKAAGKLTAMPAPSGQPTARPSQPVESRDVNSTLVVSGPSNGGIVRGQVEIRGYASGKAFASYRVEVGEGLSPAEWKAIGGDHTGRVENGVLERWDTSGLNGAYKIRVSLTEQATPATTPIPSATVQPEGAPPTATPVPAASSPRVKTVEVTVIADNTPPAVRLVSPNNETEFKKKDMERLTITAQVSDNHRLAVTEFYVDDKLVGQSNASPATVEWNTDAGVHLLRAVAKDAAGNEARSSDVRITVK
jgi:membrane carboxypeptidase/penicillin-binding protein PbpC